MIHATCDLHHGHPGQVIRQDRGNREMKEMGCSGGRALADSPEPSNEAHH